MPFLNHGSNIKIQKPVEESKGDPTNKKKVFLMKALI